MVETSGRTAKKRKTSVNDGFIFGGENEGSTERFSIVIPTHLRDDEWSATIGGIQSQLDTPLALDIERREILFDFNQCRWIDPLPLLSLLIEAIRAKWNGYSVHAQFPLPDAGPHETEVGPYQVSPNRLLLFFARETLNK